jgi:hypothetical protein
MPRLKLRKPRLRSLDDNSNGSKAIAVDASRPVISPAPVHFVRPLLVSRSQAGQILGVCARTVDLLVARKELETRRIGSRLLIVMASLEQYCNGGRLAVAPDSNDTEEAVAADKR